MAAAGTAAIGGLARPQAHDIGEAAAHAASYQDGSLTHQEVRMATGRFAFCDFLICLLGELWMKWSSITCGIPCGWLCLAWKILKLYFLEVLLNYISLHTHVTLFTSLPLDPTGSKKRCSAVRRTKWRSRQWFRSWCRHENMGKNTLET